MSKLGDMERFAHYTKCLARDVEDMLSIADAAHIFKPTNQLMSLGSNEADLLRKVKEFIVELQDYQELLTASYNNLLNSCNTPVDNQS